MLQRDILTQKNFKRQFIIYFILFGITISSFGAFATYIFQIQSIEKQIEVKAKETFAIKTESILKPVIKSMDGIVLSLGKNKNIIEFVKTGCKQKKEEIENIFLAVAGTNHKIMQARILDKTGKEIVRVDRSSENDQPFIVQTAKLQDKSKRDYFKKVSEMKTESIWHSVFDLNIENNKIEFPYRPTIRIAMPILQNDEFAGAIIVNLLTTELFNAIHKSSGFKHYIIDKDKNYILHEDNRLSFNKYKNIYRKLEDDFPDGLNTKGIYAYPIEHILQNGEKAVFILKSKDTYKESLIKEMTNTGIIIFSLTILLSFILALFSSKAPTKLQNSLFNAHQKLKEFTNIIDKYIIIATTTPEGKIVDVSSAFIQSSGYSKDELIGKPMSIIKNPKRDKSIIKDLWDTVSSKKTWVGEIQNRRKDGEIYWLEQHVVPKLDKNGFIDSYVSIGMDITAKKELEKLASIDKLTGVYNRRRVDEFLQTEIEIAKRHSQKLSVIIVDIDHFKSVNDTHGHQRGDIVLSKTAQIISENLRKSDIFGRYGGEEFLIISTQTNKEQAYVLAEKLRAAVEAYRFEIVGQKTICLGVAELDEGDNEKTVIEKADKALYEAKNSGRNKTVIYT